MYKQLQYFRGLTINKIKNTLSSYSGNLSMVYDMSILVPPIPLPCR